MQTWQLQEAKARLSEVVKRAISEGPQEITVRGESTAVVISRDEYEKLQAPQKTLLEVLRASPFVGFESDFPRNKTSNRTISFDE
jgi:antitoxin Phd